MKQISETTAQAAWIDFLQRIESARNAVGCSPRGGIEPWFRGHNRSDYKLMPSLLRWCDEPNGKKNKRMIREMESDLFWEFAARSREIHGVVEDDWEVLCTMQHYGMPTRLLDWTEVFGVAVYFATLGVASVPDGTPPPSVWVLNPYRLNCLSGLSPYDDDGSLADLFLPQNLGWDAVKEVYYTYGDLLSEGEMDWDYPYAIYPRQRNARVHAQRAWFTIHGDEFIPLDDYEDCSEYAREVEMPPEAIEPARQFLESSGIDHYLLFADLDSLSLHLMEKNGFLSREAAARRMRERIDRRKVDLISETEVRSVRGRRNKK